MDGIPHGGCYTPSCTVCFPNQDKFVIERTVEDIKRELNAAIARDNKRKEELAKRTVAEYVFTLLPTTLYTKDLYDTTCSLYTLMGMVTNREELRKVGKSPFEGQMTYVYNSLSSRFVIAVSGGCEFVDDADCWQELSVYITLNPRGGDVTEIVNKYRKF